MKTIPLTQGKEALVDDRDYEYLMQWKWTLQSGGHKRTDYTVRSCGGRRRQQTIFMHRLIAERSGLDVAGKEVDHWDHDGLNNQRGNLRIATAAQNQANRQRDRANTSGFKGVSWCRRTGKWRAYITVAGRFQHLDRFSDPREAARAYNRAALMHFGEFACLNPV